MHQRKLQEARHLVEAFGDTNDVKEVPHSHTKVQIEVRQSPDGGGARLINLGGD